MAVLKLLYSSLLNMDYLSPEPELNFREKPRYRTFLGLIMTLMAITFSFLTVRFSMENFFTKTNPDVFSNSEWNAQPLYLNTTNYKYFITVLTLDSNTGILIPINKSEVNPPFMIYGVRNSSGYYLNPISPMDNCGSDTFEDFNSGVISSNKYSPEVIQDFQATSYCPPSNYTFPLVNEMVSLSQVQIGFDSSSYSELIKKYGSVAIRITYQSVVLFPNNFEDYHKKIWNQYEFYMDEDRVLMYQLDLEEKTITKDQTTFIFQSQVKTTSINANRFYLRDSTKQRHLPTWDFAVSIGIGKDTVNTAVLIKYTSLDNIISGFGGSFEIIRTFCELVVYFIVKNFFVPEIMNRVFNFHMGGADGLSYKDIYKQFKDNNDLDEYKGDDGLVPIDETIPKVLSNENVIGNNHELQYDNNISERSINSNLKLKENLNKSDISSNLKLEKSKIIDNNNDFIIKTWNNNEIPSLKIERNNISLTKIKSSQDEDKDKIKNSNKTDLKLTKPNTYHTSKVEQLNKSNYISLNQIIDKEKSKTNLHKSVTLYDLPVKQNYKVKASHYFKAKILSCCYKRTLKDKIIIFVSKIIERFSDITSIIKSRISLEIITTLIFSKQQRQMILFPSVNLNEEDSLNYLSKFITENLNIDQENSSIKRLLKHSDANSRLKRKMIKNYLRYNI